jgi:hypothetical protein
MSHAANPFVHEPDDEPLVHVLVKIVIRGYVMCSVITTCGVLQGRIP